MLDEVHDRFLKAVGEFHTAFDVKDSVELRASLIKEETKELKEALENTIKEAVDLAYVIVGGVVAETDMDEDMIADAIDLLKVVGEFIPQRVFNEAFTRVHESNMSKLGEDGKPVRREDGKVLKGPNYQPADMTGLVQRISDGL